MLYPGAGANSIVGPEVGDLVVESPSRHARYHWSAVQPNVGFTQKSKVGSCTAGDKALGVNGAYHAHLRRGY